MPTMCNLANDLQMSDKKKYIGLLIDTSHWWAMIWICHRANLELASLLLNRVGEEQAAKCIVLIYKTLLTFKKRF